MRQASAVMVDLPEGSAAHRVHQRCCLCRTVELLRDHGADTQAHGKGWFHLVQGVRCGELIDHTEVRDRP